jgi:hypothetical protein
VASDDSIEVSGHDGWGGMRNLLLRPFGPLVIVLAFGAASSPGMAAEEAETGVLLQEFFLAETVQSQERGEIQLTLRAEASNRDDEGELEVPFELEYGITDRRWFVASSGIHHVLEPARRR